jgi:hypothetical protein
MGLMKHTAKLKAFVFLSCLAIIAGLVAGEVRSCIGCHERPYYGSYYGRRHLRYRGHPNFRPLPTVAEAISTVAPLPEKDR